LTMRNNEIAYSGDGGDVAAITLYDATGRQVGFRPSGESSIDIHNLQKGMYIAVFNLKNNNTLKLKFIKNFTDMK